MKVLKARVVSVYAGGSADSSLDQRESIEVALDGVVGDSHRSYERRAWAGGDKQPEGTIRRNERQWSAVAVEELAEITTALDLVTPLEASVLGANFCLEGVAQLSRLPKGTVLKFPSGAELQVEEYNPPCGYMGEKVAARYATQSGTALSNTAFSKAAKLTRGIVGVVEVAGEVKVGDSVEVHLYEQPAWLQRTADA